MNSPLFPERYQLGKWVHEHYQPGFMVDGHIITGVEMLALLYWRDMQTIESERERIRREVEHAADSEG